MIPSLNLCFVFFGAIKSEGPEIISRLGRHNDGQLMEQRAMHASHVSVHPISGSAEREAGASGSLFFTDGCNVWIFFSSPLE